MAEALTDVNNRYRVLATLGQGGMGTVYLVEDSTSGKQVALKVMSPPNGVDQASLLQFKQEFRIMAKLKHPNNCEVYDFGLLPDGRPYFTMEVVPGHGLDELIPIPQDKVIDLLKQLGSALGFIHQQGFVHCDLKPENIRVTPEGVVKLMDFGLMEVAGQSGGAIKGTLAYMAPEVAKRDRVDQRADIYSLGAVTYHLLAGKAPFEGATPMEVLRAHLNQQAKSLKEHDGAIPAVVDQSIQKMLAKEPIARQQSIFDVLMGLGIEVDEGAGASLLASAFVGRQAEMAKLQAALAKVAPQAGGQPSVHWVTSPAGVGKSRLLGEFRFAVQLAELPFLYGAGGDEGRPYGAFVEVLRSAIPAAKAHAAEYLHEHAPLLAKLLPELADGREAPRLEPDQEKVLLQGVIAQLLIKATASTGAVLVLDAWDRSDALSQETLTYLLRLAEGAPLMVVGASRAAEVPAGQAMVLASLTNVEVAELAQSMLGVSSLPEGFASQLVELSAGNPAHLITLLEHLVRAGVLTKAKGRWQLPETLASDQLPGDAKALLLQRLEGRSASALAVAKLAAVLGSPMPLEMAARLLGLGDDDLFDALDELLQGKVLDVVGPNTYAFPNGDLRSAIYDQMAQDERLALHGQVASHLQAQLPSEGEPELNLLTQVAHHHLHGPDDAAAVQYALAAGRRNADIVANLAAQGLLDAGLARLERAFGQEPGYRPMLGDYKAQLAALARFTGRYEQLESHGQGALAIAEEMGDQARQAEVLATLARREEMRHNAEGYQAAVDMNVRIAEMAKAQGNMRLASRALLNHGRCLMFMGRNDEARSACAAAHELAKAHGVELYEARAACMLGYLTTFDLASREEGFRYLAEATAQQQRIGDKYGEGYSYMLLTNVQMSAGRFREAEQSTVRYAEIVRDLGATEDLAVALLNQSMILHDRGQDAKAIEVGEACLKLASSINHKQAWPIVLGVLAAASFAQGDYAKAEDYLVKATDKAKECGPYISSYVVPYRLEAQVHMGRLQEALATAQEARDLIASTQNTEIEAKLWITMGEIHVRSGELPAARSYFERALEHGGKAGEPHIVARAQRGLGWLELTAGRRDEAEPFLLKAREAAGQLGMEAVAAELELLLGQLAFERQQKPEAKGRYQEALDRARELGIASLEAVALYGLFKTSAGAEAQSHLKAAKGALQVLLERLDEGQRDAFLTFMERAQLHREEGGSALPTRSVSAERPEAAPALPEEATAEERAHWVHREINAAADAAAGEAKRLASLANEYEVLAKQNERQSSHIKDLEQANRRMEQLIKFSMVVGTLQDLDKILEQAVDMIVEITGAERGFLLFFENGQIRSQVSRVNVDRRSPMDWQFSKSIAERVLTKGEVVCVFDALSDSQFNQAQSVIDLNLRTVICVPMRVKGQLIGAIYVDRQSINETFTPNDLELVMSLAAQAAGAIDNARTHQDWVDKSRRLEMLNHLSKTISGSLEMEEVLDLIVKMTLEVSRAERGFLFLLDNVGRKLLCRAARDKRGSLPIDEDHEVSQSIVKKVLETGKPENVADAMNDEEFQFQQSIMALNLRMVMCVPIFASGKIIGLLYVDSQAIVNAFSDKDLELLAAIAGHASVAIENARLHEKTMALADDLRKTFYSFVHALGAAIDAKHPLTAGHSFRVTEYSVRLARRIGLPEDEVENIRIAGLLHDVGKIGTPDHILMKPGSFTNEEYEIMKMHVVHTREILDTIHFPAQQRHIPAMAGAHHEKWDGRGYPNKEAGEDIPLGGRILALGDVFDAITSKRDYREAMPLSQALNIIRQGIGSHFDPALGPVFIEMIEEEGVVVYEHEEQGPEPEPKVVDLGAGGGA